MIFHPNVFGPWQETFADAGDGDGEGTIWHHLAPLWNNFKIILDPFLESILGLSTKDNFP